VCFGRRWRLIAATDHGSADGRPNAGAVVAWRQFVLRLARWHNEREEQMGLFDFVRNIGRKIFESDADANDRIKKEIETSLKGVEGLTVDYDPASGLVKLGGTAASSEAMEKAVLIAGNALGVANVNVDGLRTPEESKGVEFYVIKSGDTLSAIAQHFYKDPNKYPKIFEANREVIKDPNLIFPGQKIRIPAA